MKNTEKAVEWFQGEATEDKVILTKNALFNGLIGTDDHLELTDEDILIIYENEMKKYPHTNWWNRLSKSDKQMYSSRHFDHPIFGNPDHESMTDKEIRFMYDEELIILDRDEEN